MIPENIWFDLFLAMVIYNHINMWISTSKSHFFEKTFIDTIKTSLYNKDKILNGGESRLLQYKIDVIPELAKVGINTTTAKKSGIFGQDTMRKFRNGDTKISLEVLNRLCCVLEMQPRDIIKFVETDEDREKIISKICEKVIDNHWNMWYIITVQREQRTITRKGEGRNMEHMNMQENARLVLGLRAAGWSEKKINDFILYIETGEEQYKPEPDRQNKEAE